MEITAKFERVDIQKMIHYARNTCTIASRVVLREFGFANPIIVDEDLNIIASYG